MTSTTLSTLTLIALVAVVAPLLSEVTRNRVPGVVIELAAGILIGPDLLGWATTDAVVTTLGAMGLTFLFFMAGFELDIARIKGKPLNLAVGGWFASLALAFACAGFLVFLDVGLSTLLIGLALTTTALGTLLPILGENGEVETRFGSFVIAIGGAGEFLPIVAIALFLTTDHPFAEVLLLVGFVVLAVGAVAVALRPTPSRLQIVLGRTLNSPSQLPIRIAVLLIVLLVWVASHLGLDTLLGAFVAGLIVRQANHDESADVIETKLSALSYGLFIPVFFVVSGMGFDLDALTRDPSTLLRLPLFLALFFVVRGIPTLLIHARALPRTELMPAALLASTALPLVVAITTIGVDQGRMRPANAAALVGAGMLSVLFFPLGAFALRRRTTRREAVAEARGT